MTSQLKHEQTGVRMRHIRGNRKTIILATQIQLH